MADPDLYLTVYQVLTTHGHLDKAGALAWLNTKHLMLDGSAPVDRINEGRGYEVRNLAYLLGR